MLVAAYLCQHAHHTRISAHSSAGTGTESKVSYFRATIPVQILVSATGLKSKDLEQMQVMVGTYLNESAVGRNSNRYSKHKRGQQKRRREDDNTGVTASPRVSVSPSDLIRDLCIQLGPMIPDAEFALNYATNMFHFLTHPRMYSDSVPSERRRQFMEVKSDLERHQEYYEAVCFYLAVKKSEGTNNSYSKRIAKKKANRIDHKLSLQNNKDGTMEDVDDEEEEEENDDDRPLNEVDVCATANLLEGTFKTVIALVSDLIQDIQLDLGKGASSGFNIDESGKDDGAKSGKRKVNIEGDGKVAKGNNQPSIHEQNSSINNAFEKWKHQVLREAKDAALEKVKEKGDATAATLEERDLLHNAADEVLRSFGLKHN